MWSLCANSACHLTPPEMVTLHPSKPPLATIGRALTLIQVIFYLPLTLDVGGFDAFLALSASLAVYYFLLSTLRLLSPKWIGDTFAAFQFLVIPSCLAISWAVYCPPEQNYFFVRWFTTLLAAASNNPVVVPLSGSGNQTSSSMYPALNDYHPATPPHLAAILQALTPILFKSRDHPYLERSFQISSRAILFLARKIPSWWGTLLRLSSPLFSFLEGSATLLVIQVIGNGCRYIIATSVSPTSKSNNASDDRRDSRNKSSDSSSGRSSRRALHLYLLSSIGIRGSEAWQLFFLLSSAIIYVISGWALYLSFPGVFARGGGASLMMGISISSVCWLSAIAFAIGKGNVVETALIFAYTCWNIFTLSTTTSTGSTIDMLTRQDHATGTYDPLTIVRSFKNQLLTTTHTTTHQHELLSTLTSYMMDLKSRYIVINESIEFLKVTFGQSWLFLNALYRTLPSSVIISLIYRLMVLYLASRILPFLLHSNRRQHHHHNSSHRRRHHHRSRRTDNSSDDDDNSSSSSSHRRKNRSQGETGGSPMTRSNTVTSSSSTSSSSSSSSSSASTSTSSNSRGRSSSSSSNSSSSSSSGSASDYTSSSSYSDGTTVDTGARPGDHSHSRRSSSSSPPPPPPSRPRTRKPPPPPSSKSRRRGRESEPFGSFINIIVSYARLILIAVYSHLLLLDQSHQTIWKFSTIGVSLGLWTLELCLATSLNGASAGGGDEFGAIESIWDK
ncbi:unnamed protein product [Sympodiomycopsis kandeliae]